MNALSNFDTIPTTQNVVVPVRISDHRNASKKIVMQLDNPVVVELSSGGDASLAQAQEINYIGFALTKLPSQDFRALAKLDESADSHYVSASIELYADEDTRRSAGSLKLQVALQNNRPVVRFQPGLSTPRSESGDIDSSAEGWSDIKEIARHLMASPPEGTQEFMKLFAASIPVSPAVQTFLENEDIEEGDIPELEIFQDA